MRGGRKLQAIGFGCTRCIRLIHYRTRLKIVISDAISPEQSQRWLTLAEGDQTVVQIPTRLLEMTSFGMLKAMGVELKFVVLV